VVNLGARYALTPWLTLTGQVNNLFESPLLDRRAARFNRVHRGGDVRARPFPAVGGEFPLTHSTFYAPGAPIRGWAGLRVRF
jgi:outer membrane receptor protein involved in Fe transport